MLLRFWTSGIIFVQFVKYQCVCGEGGGLDNIWIKKEGSTPISIPDGPLVWIKNKTFWYFGNVISEEEGIGGGGAK